MRRANILAKAVLVALIAVSLVFGDAERFHDKAMGAPAIAYPLLCAVPAEYSTFVQTVEQLGIRDTIGDLSLGTAGALCAGVVTAWAQHRRPLART